MPIKDTEHKRSGARKKVHVEFCMVAFWLAEQQRHFIERNNWRCSIYWPVRDKTLA